MILRPRFIFWSFGQSFVLNYKVVKSKQNFYARYYLSLNILTFI